MADAPATTSQSGSSFGFLARKIGPLPVWAWGAIGFGAWWWYTRHGPGAKPATPAQPQVVVVQDKDAARPPRKRRRGPPAAAMNMPAPQPQPEPVPAAAPMTAGDVYGDVPVASMDGTTYDSGYPSAAQMGGAYVPAG